VLLLIFHLLLRFFSAVYCLFLCKGLATVSLCFRGVYGYEPLAFVPILQCFLTLRPQARSEKMQINRFTLFLLDWILPIDYHSRTTLMVDTIVVRPIGTLMFYSNFELGRVLRAMLLSPLPYGS
jgi:hypothetical protein